MKNLTTLATVAIVSLAISSCCSMFGGIARGAGYRTETVKKKTCGYEIVTEEVETPGSSKDGKASIETIEKKVPKYKEVTRKKRIPCPKCTRLYCPKKDCCGTTGEGTLKLATEQGGTGSPNIGLIPTMKPLAE